MKTKNFAIISIVLIAFAIWTASSEASVTATQISKATWNSLSGTDSESRQFTSLNVLVRAGGGSGTPELGIGPAYTAWNSGFTSTTDVVWSSGIGYNFSLTNDGSGAFTLSIANSGTTSVYRILTPFTDLIISETLAADNVSLSLSNDNKEHTIGSLLDD